MKLVIRDHKFGDILSVVFNITIAPTANSTVTTEDGSYEIFEVAYDYKNGHVNAYTSEYDHDPVEYYNKNAELIK
jgi:hypothetical protein